MGVDFLDMVIELERLFTVRIEPDDLHSIWMISDRKDCTAGELHDLVCRKCISCGVPVPRSSWNRVKIALVKSAGVKPSEITRDKWLRRDLQMY